jgi:hypothetical protein
VPARSGPQWLRGIREIELACWYGDTDAEALAKSPHLDAVERVVLWSESGLEQARLMAGGSAWPGLKDLHLVSQSGAQEEWVRAVNEAARRPLASVYDFGSELFPFAADFAGPDSPFLVGKLPDGTQVFACGFESDPIADGWLFHPDGTIREPFRFEFPPELVLPLEKGRTPDGESRWHREQQIFAARKAVLAERTGFLPAFIRVEGFTLEASGLAGPGRYHWEIEEMWGEPDAPVISPEIRDWVGGYGSLVYRAIRDGEYTFDYGDGWRGDRTGHLLAPL